MKSIFLCLFCLLAASGWAQSLTYDDVMKGFTTNIKGEARWDWFDSLYRQRNTLTNDALKKDIAYKMIEILHSGQSSNQDKCAAAHIIGLLSLEQGIEALINNFGLYNEEPTGQETIYLREGELPAQIALVNIGESAVPAVMAVAYSATSSYTLQRVARILLSIKGQEDGARFLKQAIAEQTDSKKKDTLKAVLASDYFIDPKYRLIGPKEKIKKMLAREQR